jgi:putative spermidine/putrescine transport system substrate-binding protein
VVVAAAGFLLSGGEARSAAPSASRSWPDTLRAARGETVQFWLYGGDARINAYLDGPVTRRLAALGVHLHRVPIDDTAGAIDRLAAERRDGAGRGAIDLVWVNGANFATAKASGLWAPGWASTLPNARLFPPGDQTLQRDFGVAVDGQESPWSRAAFVFAYDSSRTPNPPRSFPALLAYAKAHPGRIAYPAPPDFTGSAFVRLAVQELAQQRAFALLKELKPVSWQRGATYPSNEAALDQLFANGQVDLAMSYDPSFIETAVANGQFPAATRPLILGGATLENVSFVAMPADAPHPDAARVLANLLLDPQLQAAKADPRILGVPTVLDPASLPPAATGSSPYLLASFGTALAELPASQVPLLDGRWRREVLP